MASGIEVFSDQFTYATNTGRGIYRGHVRATGTNLAMTSRVLEILMPTQEKKGGRLESISADGEVEVDSSGIQASGEHSVYTVLTDQVFISGHPTWREGEKDGSADELIVERTNGVLHANGNARLTAPATRAGGYGFLSLPGEASAPASNSVPKIVEIHSDSYLLRTNFAFFQDQVRAEERAGGKVEGTMTCAQLTMAGAGSNPTDTAEREVDIRETDEAAGEKRRFTAGKAVYDGASGAIELTQNPKWEASNRAGVRQGTGDVMTVSGDPQALVAKGHAFMRLPADDLAAPPGMGQTSRPPATTRSLTNTFAEIHSTSYRLTSFLSTFQGPVHVEHPRMTWDAGNMNVEQLKDKRSRRILAGGGVVFDMLDEKGQTLHGTGDKSDMVSGVQTDPSWLNGLAGPYLKAGTTNEILVLAGQPAVLETQTDRPTSDNPTNKTPSNVTNKIIVLDGIEHQINVFGRYRMWGKGPPANTNSFELPGAKFMK
jgi:lipopolysaccharide export system protein LptA